MKRTLQVFTGSLWAFAGLLLWAFTKPSEGVAMDAKTGQMLPDMRYVLPSQASISTTYYFLLEGSIWCFAVFLIVGGLEKGKWLEFVKSLGWD